MASTALRESAIHVACTAHCSVFQLETIPLSAFWDWYDSVQSYIGIINKTS